MQIIDSALFLEGSNTELHVSRGMVIVSENKKSPIRTIVIDEGSKAYPTSVDVQWNSYQSCVIIKAGSLLVRGRINVVEWYGGTITIEGNGTIKKLIVHPDKDQTNEGPRIKFDRAYPSQVKSIVKIEETKQ